MPTLAVHNLAQDPLLTSRAVKGKPKEPPEKKRFTGPKSSIHLISTKKSWAWGSNSYLGINTLDSSTYFLKSLDDIFITAINLLNVVDGTGSFCRKCGNQKGNSGPNIG